MMNVATSVAAPPGEPAAKPAGQPIAPSPTVANDENAIIAERLREAGALLEAQGANPFRANAYRRAALTVESLTESVRAVFERGGPEALDALPGIGRGIRSAIAEMLITGRWGQLDRLRGAVGPGAVFQSVPGIGPELAERLHDTLGADTLEALEAAAYDGRLASVAGIGPRRLAALRASLARILGRARANGEHIRHAPQPSIDLLLDVDREYRERAAAHTLPTIAPKRFNPTGQAWLPVLHTDRDGWHCTALFSNTPRAHELGRTHDWVVIYCYDHDHAEVQFTVVTEGRGKLAGRRVVRGREAACRTHYAKLDADR